jgi:hypothetical protein
MRRLRQTRPKPPLDRTRLGRLSRKIAAGGRHYFEAPDERPFARTGAGGPARARFRRSRGDPDAEGDERRPERGVF